MICIQNLWTSQEDELLRSLCEAGLPWPEIAEQFERSLGAVRSRVKTQGLKGPKSPCDHLWTSQEDELLRSLCEAGLRWPEIAEQFERSLSAVKNRVRRLGLGFRWSKGPCDHLWTSQEDELLRSLCEAGLRWPEIAEQFERSLGAVRSRVARLRLKGAKSASDYFWSSQENDLLRSLCEAGLPWPEIAERFGRSVPAVKAHTRKLGLRHNGQGLRPVVGNLLEENGGNNDMYGKDT